MKSKSKSKSKSKKTNSIKTNQSIDKMKYEIANEFGVNLGANASSRSNGAVGGEITKRLVNMGRSKLGGSSNSNK